MADENEFNFMSEEESSEKLYEQLNAEYQKTFQKFKELCPKELLKDKLEKIAETKEVFQRVLAEHRGDGDYAALVLGAVATKGLAQNLLACAAIQGTGAFVGNLCNSVVMPMVVAWQAEEARTALEKEIEELEQ